VYLYHEQIDETLELVMLIPSEMILRVTDLQLEASEKENSVLLCNVQPRVDTVKWETFMKGNFDESSLQQL